MPARGHLTFPAIATGLSACFLAVGCAPLAGMEAQGRLVDPHAGSRYSASIRTSSSNTFGKVIDSVGFEMKGAEVKVTYRKATHSGIQVAISENDSIRCILVADTYQGNGDYLHNRVTGEKFPFKISRGILKSKDVLFHLDRSPRRHIDYNLAGIQHDIVLDTVSRMLTGTLDTLPPSAKLFIYPLARRAEEEQPIEVKEKVFRIQLDSTVYGAFGKFVSDYGWDLDFKIPTAVPQ